MDKIVRSITLVGTGPTGSSVETVFGKGSKRAKSSRFLKPVEKIQRRMLEAHKTFADEALALHEKYARKRKDGWLRDAPVIVFKANRKALKKLTDW